MKPVIGMAACAAMFGVALMLPTCGVAAMNDQGNAQAPAYAEGSGSESAQTIDDATLKRTAAAYVKVRDIALKAQQAVGNTSDQDAKQRMVEKAESDKVAAVKSEGIEPQQYNNVILAVRSNTDLQQKFLGFVQQVRSGSSGGSL
jgi:hypothetical protein